MVLFYFLSCCILFCCFISARFILFYLKKLPVVAVQMMKTIFIYKRLFIEHCISCKSYHGIWLYFRAFCRHVFPDIMIEWNKRNFVFIYIYMYIEPHYFCMMWPSSYQLIPTFWWTKVFHRFASKRVVMPPITTATTLPSPERLRLGCWNSHSPHYHCLVLTTRSLPFYHSAK